MEIEEALKTYLETKTALTALITQNSEVCLYPEEIPQKINLNNSGAVSYIKISDTKGHTLTGQSKLEQPIFQYSVLAETRAKARAITNQLKAALCDQHGTFSGIVIQKIELQNEMSNLETSSDGTVKVYTEDLEFQISFERS